MFELYTLTPILNLEQHQKSIKIFQTQSRHTVLREKGVEMGEKASKIKTLRIFRVTPKPWGAGSNPPAPANKKGTFVYQKFLFRLSKPQAWHIIAAQHAAHIISPFGAVSHHALACIYLRLDDIQHFVLMICNSYGIDDIPQQVADDIQGLRLDLFTIVWYNKLTDK